MLLSTLLILATPIASFARSLCITHAGDKEMELKNSMASFRSAYRRGANGTELDVRHTKDRVAIISHDVDLSEVAQSKPSRNCPLQTKVSDMTFETIRTECQLVNGEEVPTLQEVFEEFADKDFYILLDLKDQPRKGTIRLINEYAKNSSIHIRSLINFASDLSALMTLRSRIHTPCYLSNGKYIPLSDLIFDGVDVATITDKQLKALQRRGKTISFYGASDPTSLARVFGIGVDLITTDTLALCQQFQ